MSRQENGYLPPSFLSPSSLICARVFRATALILKSLSVGVGLGLVAGGGGGGEVNVKDSVSLLSA